MQGLEQGQEVNGMAPSNLSSQGPISLPNKTLLVLLKDPNCNKKRKTDSEPLPQLPTLPNKLCLLGHGG